MWASVWWYLRIVRFCLDVIYLQCSCSTFNKNIPIEYLNHSGLFPLDRKRKLHEGVIKTYCISHKSEVVFITNYICLYDISLNLSNWFLNPQTSDWWLFYNRILLCYNGLLWRHNRVIVMRQSQNHCDMTRVWYGECDTEFIYHTPVSNAFIIR